jgi:hypothetical protein
MMWKKIKRAVPVVSNRNKRVRFSLSPLSVPSVSSVCPCLSSSSSSSSSPSSPGPRDPYEGIYDKTGGGSGPEFPCLYLEQKAKAAEKAEKMEAKLQKTLDDVCFTGVESDAYDDGLSTDTEEDEEDEEDKEHEKDVEVVEAVDEEDEENEEDEEDEEVLSDCDSESSEYVVSEDEEREKPVTLLSKRTGLTYGGVWSFVDDNALVSLLHLLGTFTGKAARRNANSWLQNTSCSHCRKGTCEKPHVYETAAVIARRNAMWKRGVDEIVSAKETVDTCEDRLQRTHARLNAMLKETRQDVKALVSQLPLCGDVGRPAGAVLTDAAVWSRLEASNAQGVFAPKMGVCMEAIRPKLMCGGSEVVFDDGVVVELTNALGLFSLEKGKLVDETADDVVRRNQVWVKSHRALRRLVREVENASASLAAAHGHYKEVVESWRTKVRGPEVLGYFQPKAPEEEELGQKLCGVTRRTARAASRTEALELEADLVKAIVSAQRDGRMQPDTDLYSVKPIATRCGISLV